MTIDGKIYTITYILSSLSFHYSVIVYSIVDSIVYSVVYSTGTYINVYAAKRGGEPNDRKNLSLIAKIKNLLNKRLRRFFEWNDCFN